MTCSIYTGQKKIDLSTTDIFEQAMLNGFMQYMSTQGSNDNRFDRKYIDLKRHVFQCREIIEAELVLLKAVRNILTDAEKYELDRMAVAVHHFLNMSKQKLPGTI